MSNLVPMSDMERMAVAVAKSGLFGMRTPEQALALMCVAAAEGMHPAMAARDYHIIQGRPSLKADSMLARFQASGGKVKWTSYTDQKVAAIFSHPQGGEVEIEWTMERARSAGLGGKDVWKQYPRQMLRARVISEGVRTVYPGCIAGFYTPEEVMDFDTKQEEINITPQNKAEHIEVKNVEVLEPAEEKQTELITSAQTKKLYVLAKEVGYSSEQMKELLTQKYNIDSSKHLTKQQASELIEYLEQIKINS